MKLLISFLSSWMWLSTSRRYIIFPYSLSFYFSEGKRLWCLIKCLQVNSTHRYLVGVLLADLSDVFYSLFCWAEKQIWVNGNAQSRWSAGKTADKADAHWPKERRQAQGCSDGQMRLHSNKQRQNKEEQEKTCICVSRAFHNCCIPRKTFLQTSWCGYILEWTPAKHNELS